MIDKWFCC